MLFTNPNTNASLDQEFKQSQNSWTDAYFVVLIVMSPATSLMFWEIGNFWDYRTAKEWQGEIKIITYEMTLNSIL